MSIVLTWSENCVLTDIITYAAVAAHGDDPALREIRDPTNASRNCMYQ